MNILTWRRYTPLTLSMILSLIMLVSCGADDSDRARSAFEGTGTSQSNADQAGGTLPEGHPPLDGLEPDVATRAASDGQVAGLGWTVPDGWRLGPEKSMRAATYIVTVDGAAAPVECAVYYFGPSQGGGIRENIDRWIGQFDQPDGSSSQAVAVTEKLEVNGMPVTTVEVSGTYTASMGGPMSGGGGALEDYRMRGAIIEGPQGAVFFKLTGPDTAVVTLREHFDAMIGSVNRHG